MNVSLHSNFVVSRLMQLLAIRLSCQKTTAKSLVILCREKNFLLTCIRCAALRSGISRQSAQRKLANFSRALHLG